RWKTIAHRAKPTRSQQGSGIAEFEELSRPHLVLPHIGCDNRVAGSMPGEFFNDPLRLDQLVIHLIAERMTLSPFSDLLIPSVIQTGKMLGRGQLSNFLIQP